ncbi:MAG: FAD-dependent oxidoreductase [Pseudomonadota bacterium]
MTELRPDICVIGGGSAGLTVAAAASSFGHNVVLIERGKMGGDCLNYGCVPSKALIAAAKYAHAAREGAKFGINADPAVAFGKVHEHVHSVIDAIAPHDSVERFEGLGVTVLKAHAMFVDGETVDVEGTRVRAKRFVVATGSSPMLPPIPGLADCRPLTNESVFDLTDLPRRLAVIGGGPIGAELSQAFARLGSSVRVATDQTLLPADDPDAVEVVRKSLQADGVQIHERAAVTGASSHSNGLTLTLEGGGQLEADRVLVAAGRAPNVENLGLEKAGIAFDQRGIKVGADLRTSNRRIYAIGDVVGGLQFTHVAGHHASLAVRAIVFRMPVKYNADLMPRVTYTSPELAQVGLNAAAAQARFGTAHVSMAPFARNDRAEAEGKTSGFVKLIMTPKGRLAGATIVAPQAGELIATYALALAAKVPVKTIASFTPAYPTFAETGKRAAINHFAAQLGAPWVKRVLGLLKRLP